jgi:excisionase family DNA binding protein
MPVIQRLANSPVARRTVVSTTIRAGRLQAAPQLNPQPQVTVQRCLNVKAAAKYLGTSTWQVRKFFREGVLKPFMVGNRWMLDRADLGALIEHLKAA